MSLFIFQFIYITTQCRRYFRKRSLIYILVYLYYNLGIDALDKSADFNLYSSLFILQPAININANISIPFIFQFIYITTLPRIEKCNFIPHLYSSLFILQLIYFFKECVINCYLYSSLFILQPRATTNQAFGNTFIFQFIYITTLPPPAIKSLCLIYILVYLYYNTYIIATKSIFFRIYILVYLYYNNSCIDFLICSICSFIFQFIYITTR